MITVRPATPSDLPTIQTLNTRIFVHNVEYDADFLNGFEHTPEGEKFFHTMITNPKGCCFLAEEDGNVIGYASGEDHPAAWRKHRYFELDVLGVVQDKQAHGVGKKLLDAVTNWAKERGFQRMYLNCYSKNTTAIEFYRHHGFNQIDVSFEKEI